MLFPGVRFQPIYCLLGDTVGSPWQVVAHWRKHGFFWPRGGPLHLILLTDLVVSRMVYGYTDTVVLSTDPTRPGVYDGDGKVLFPREHFLAYLTALRAALGREPSPKLPSLRRLHASIITAIPGPYSEDPVVAQLRLLHRLWGKRVPAGLCLDDLRTELLSVYGGDDVEENRLTAILTRTRAWRAKRGRDQASVTEIVLTVEHRGDEFRFAPRGATPPAGHPGDEGVGCPPS